MLIEHFKTVLKSIIKKTVVALVAATLVACWAVPCAYAERGYKAVGGEALLILATFVFVLWLSGRDFRKIIKKFRKERKEKCLDVSTAAD